MLLESVFSGGKERAAFLNSRIQQIRESYEQRKWTASKKLQNDANEFEREISEAKEKCRQGKITTKKRDDIIHQNETFIQILGGIKSTIVKQEGDQKDKDFAEWESTDLKYGRVSFTSEGSRHWRNANPNEEKGTLVLFHHEKYGPMFGRFQEVIKTRNGRVAEVYSYCFQRGETSTWWRSEPLFGRAVLFKDVQVVPDAVLRKMHDEAPPGKFFSGRDDKVSSVWDNILNFAPWCPSPQGKVWHNVLETPSSPAAYMDEESDRIMKRIIHFGPGSGAFLSEAQNKGFDDNFACHVWCPVTYRFLSEPQMFRSKFWFHNGNGSAQQRYFYNQNEMLEKNGGLKNVPLRVKFVPRSAVPGYEGGHIRLEFAPRQAEDTPTNDEPSEVRVRTLDQVIDDKFDKAERAGKMIRLE